MSAEATAAAGQPTRDAALARLVDRIRAAHADGVALCIRGGGTKDFLGGAMVGEELSTRELRGISSYEPTELVLTARAGTPLAEVEAALAERGQGLLFEPLVFAPPAQPSGRFGPVGQPTVGGMVAAGLSGPARASVGSVRDFVLGASLINGRAEVMSFGGQVIKNVAGYDVSRLLAGSLGVLGVVAEVTLKVMPQPVATQTLRFAMDEATALRQLNQWGGQPLPLSASAWWSGTLLLRLAGAQAAVQAATDALLRQHAAEAAEVIEPAQAKAFWHGLRSHADAFFVAARKALALGATLWRVSVPQTAAPLGLSGEQLIEWHGGQRWVVTTAPAGGVRDAAAKAGGHASAFLGNDKSGAVFAPLDPVLARVHHRLKDEFDPAGIFNRGRLYPDF